MRVLVAEDHPVNRIVLQRILARQGHEVVAVEDGQAAVQAAAGGDFAVVFMDCEMPVLDGYGAARELRERGVGVPIVAMTAHEGGEERDKAFAAGMSDFLTKPPEAEVIAATVLRWTVIDEARYGALVADFDVEGARELVETFLRTTPAQIAEAAAARDAGDLAALKAAAHRLRGGALTVGAGALDELAAELEAAAAAGEITARAADLEAVWDATVTALHGKNQPG